MALRTSLVGSGEDVDYQVGEERQQSNFQGNVSTLKRTFRRYEVRWVGLTWAFAKAYADSYSGDTNTTWRPVMTNPILQSADLHKIVDSYSAWEYET